MTITLIIQVGKKTGIKNSLKALLRLKAKGLLWLKVVMLLNIVKITKY